MAARSGWGIPRRRWGGGGGAPSLCSKHLHVEESSLLKHGTRVPFTEMENTKEASLAAVWAGAGHRTRCIEVEHQEGGQCVGHHEQVCFPSSQRTFRLRCPVLLPTHPRAPPRAPSTLELLAEHLSNGCVTQLWRAPREGLDCGPTPTPTL